MADTTTVNAQITDAVTQSDAALLADAPAKAIETLYLTLSQSAGRLLENAVSAQLNQTMIATAAMSQGIALLYGAERVDGMRTIDVLSSSGALNERVQQSAEAASALADQAREAGISSAAAVAHGDTSSAVHSTQVLHAVRTSAETIAAAMQSAGQALHEDLARTLKLAATTACLAGMLRDPAKAAEYETVLAAIERLR